MIIASVLPLPVLAQLESANYQIDSYVVGEGVAAEATSTNFTGSFGTPDFIFDASDNTEGSVGSVVDRPETTTDPAAPPTPADPIDPPVPSPSVLYIVPTPTSFVPTDTTLTPGQGATGTVVITPSAQSTAVTESLYYYTILDNGNEVYVQVAAGTFVTPANYQGDTPYQIYISITEQAIPAVQLPASEYRAQLLDEVGYLITVRDSLGQTIEQFSAPLIVTIETTQTVDPDLGITGYVFDTLAEAWVKTPVTTGGTNTVTAAFSVPTLFGVWFVPNKETYLYLTLPTEPASSSIADQPTTNSVGLVNVHVVWPWLLVLLVVGWWIARRT